MMTNPLIEEALPFLSETLALIDQYTFDAQHLSPELGDVLWRESIQYDLDQVKKYKQRYKGQIALLSHLTGIPKQDIRQQVTAYRDRTGSTES